MSEVTVTSHTKTSVICIPDYTPREQQTQDVAPCKSSIPSHHARMHSGYSIEIEAIVSW